MLKPYIFYGGKPQDGAFLVFAHTAKEARIVGWECCGSLLVDRYIDCRASLMRNSDYLFAEADQDKLIKDLPHVVLSPRCCDECHYWGKSAIGHDGLCEECREEKQPIIKYAAGVPGHDPDCECGRCQAWGSVVIE